jgi:membrane complex biogenesis BtpA family protein
MDEPFRPDARAARLIGMVHLLPLPGSPRWNLHGGGLEPVLAQAGADARALMAGGMEGVIVENFGDIPFFPGRVGPETCAAMTLAVATVREVVGSQIPVGVNVLRNDAATALAIAAVTGADFIRVNVHTGTMFADQGPLYGEAHETLRMRRTLDARVSICADVHVKHALPPAGATLAESARDTARRGLADVLIVSGSGTGEPVDLDAVAQVRAAVPECPLWIGSGVTRDRVAELLEVADGVIVGSALQKDGRAGQAVEVDRVRAFVDAARARIRSAG